MYPNRLRSGTLNLVRFRSCAVVQCEHIVVFRRFLHRMCRTCLLCAIRFLPWTGARNVPLLAACMAFHFTAEAILRAMTSATPTENSSVTAGEGVRAGARDCENVDDRQLEVGASLCTEAGTDVFPSSIASREAVSDAVAS